LLVDAHGILRGGGTERIDGELADLLLIGFLLRRRARHDGHSSRWNRGRCHSGRSRRNGNGRGWRRWCRSFQQSRYLYLPQVELSLLAPYAEAQWACGRVVGALRARVVVVGDQRAVDPHRDAVGAGDNGAQKELSGACRRGACFFKAAQTSEAERLSLLKLPYRSRVGAECIAGIELSRSSAKEHVCSGVAIAIDCGELRCELQHEIVIGCGGFEQAFAALSMNHPRARPANTLWRFGLA